MKCEKEASMLSRVVEGDKFKSSFTGAVFKVKKIYTNRVLLEDVGDENHHLLTEITALVSFYQKVDKP
jgi:hypothetical protein